MPTEGHTVSDETLVITGPTASGKGALAFELARRLEGEIVSVDSMKVYKGLDIVTAKPSPARRRQVAYHLLDIVDLHDDFNVGRYLELLRRAVDEITSRGRRVILCGGSALYLKAYLEGLQSAPAADWELRAALLAEASCEGPESLHRRLVELDPVSAAKIQPTDTRRLVRSLEVLTKTGLPFSTGKTWGEGTRSRVSTRIFGLAWGRGELYRRIERRVELMVERGLFEEIGRLRDRQPPLSRCAAQTIGYKEVSAGLEKGLSREEVVEGIKKSSRRLAKRQLTWFRKFPIEWIRVTAGRADAAELADEVIRHLGQPRGRPRTLEPGEDP